MALWGLNENTKCLYVCPTHTLGITHTHTIGAPLGLHQHLAKTGKAEKLTEVSEIKNYTLRHSEMAHTHIHSHTQQNQKLGSIWPCIHSQNTHTTSQ